jgi:hypothetical protein
MKEYDYCKLICHLLSPIPGTGEKELRSAGQEGLDWPEIFRVAGNHYVTTLLAGTLKAKGLFGQLPEDVREYLDLMRQLNLKRNEILKNELLATIAELNKIDVQPLLLKGAINLVSEQYPDCADRVFGDLDLAVPVKRIRECFHWLDKAPYSAHGEFGREHEIGLTHHAHPLLHQFLPVTVELHSRVIGISAHKILPTEATWQSSSVHSQNGLGFHLPDSTSRLIHTFAHTQLQDQNHSRCYLALRPLCEFVNQRVSFDQEIDWSQIGKRLGRKHHWKLETYLLAAQELFSQTPPQMILIGRRAKRKMIRIRTCINSPNPVQPNYAFERLKQLPRRLLTPAWYAAKFNALKRGEPW